MSNYIPLFNTPIQWVDSSGTPLSSGTLNFYKSGTSTATNIYSDSSGTSLGSTVTLDSAGYPSSGGQVVTLYRAAGTQYKITLKNSAGSTIWTADGIPAVSYYDTTAATKLATIEENADVTDADSVAAVVNGVQEIFFHPDDFYLPTTGACAAAATVEGTAGLPNYRGLAFDGATSERAEILWLPPRRYNLGQITAKFYWTSAATDADSVVWGIKAQSFSDADLIAQTWGSSVTVTDTLQSAAGQMLISPETGVITIGTSVDQHDAVILTVYRDPTAAADTATEDAVLLGLRLMYTSAALNDDA